MNYNQPNNTCLFNTLYVQYVEDIGRNEFFYYDLKYPVFYNVKNGYFQVNDSVLQNLNDAINSSKISAMLSFAVFSNIKCSLPIILPSLEKNT